MWHISTGRGEMKFDKNKHHVWWPAPTSCELRINYGYGKRFYHDEKYDSSTHYAVEQEINIVKLSHKIRDDCVGLITKLCSPESIQLSNETMRRPVSNITGMTAQDELTGVTWLPQRAERADWRQHSRCSSTAVCFPAPSASSLRYSSACHYRQLCTQLQHLRRVVVSSAQPSCSFAHVLDVQGATEKRRL